MLSDTNSKNLFHLNFNPNEIQAEYAILPGDPGRIEEIGSFLDNYKLVSYNREYKIIRGNVAGKRVFVCSTGIGGPSAAIALQELFLAGVKTIIRVGTCGGIDLSVDSGDIVIATSSVRQEGTSLQYAPIEFPATADFDVTTALKTSAIDLNVNSKTHVGIIQCKDSFYGQHNPDVMPVCNELKDKWQAWKRLHVLASEMESSTLFTVASYLGVKAGTVLSVVWNQERSEEGLPCKEVHNTTIASQIAINALKYL